MFVLFVSLPVGTPPLMSYPNMKMQETTYSIRRKSIKSSQTDGSFLAYQLINAQSHRKWWPGDPQSVAFLYINHCPQCEKTCLLGSPISVYTDQPVCLFRVVEAIHFPSKESLGSREVSCWPQRLNVQADLSLHCLHATTRIFSQCRLYIIREWINFVELFPFL